MGGLLINTLKQFLNSHPEIKQIVLGMDNDDAATNFVEVVKDELGQDYKIKEFRPPNKKDWNEELLAKR